MLRRWLKRRKVRQHEAREIERMRQSELVILSFPKSGRTWHRVMLGNYLARLANEPPQASMDVTRLSRLLGRGSVTYTHNHANFTDDIEATNPIVASPNGWTGRKVILIVRDPRDVLVSAWHHARFRDMISDAPISAFVRDSRTGIDKILTALNRWNSNRHLAESFDVISYEEMHLSPAAALATSVRALGFNPEESLVKEAAVFSSFDKMKSYEREGYFNDGRMRNDSGNADGAKVRSGKVGSFREHLSEDDLHFIEQRVTEMGDPFSHKYNPS